MRPPTRACLHGWKSFAASFPGLVLAKRDAVAASRRAAESASSCPRSNDANSWPAPKTCTSIYLETGIHSAQTTPLFSRGGKLVGAISTPTSRCAFHPPARFHAHIPEKYKGRWLERPFFSFTGLSPASQLGITTVSMTWMTPLSAGISVFATWALFTMTFPPFTLILSGLPSTVLTAPGFTSAAMTLPGTTW